VPKNKGKYHGKDDPAAEVAPVEAVRGLTERALTALRPHMFKVAALAAGLAAVLIALAIYGWYDRRREAGASARFQDALKTEQARVVSADDPPMPTMPGAPAEPTFKSAQARSEAMLATLSSLEKDYGGADVAKHTRLVKAGVLYDLGRYDEAIAEYKKFLASSASGDLLRYVAREGLGYALEAKALAEKDAAARTAGLDAALAEYKQLQPDVKGVYGDYALYHQGRVLALKGDKAAAIALFKQIVDGMPGSQVASQARDRLAQLEQ
jgi:hypothetical protein